MIKFRATQSGHLVGKFKDRYGAECSIQESSYTDEACLWLGVEEDNSGQAVLQGRMHLTQDQARELAEALLHFAHEGALGQYDTDHYRVGAWVRGIGKNNFDIHGRVIHAHVGHVLTVQDQKQPGVEGHIHCVWEDISRWWTPAEAPPQGRTLFEHLTD